MTVRTWARDRYNVLAALWGFFIFLPYPAIPVGGNTGLQMGHLMLLGLAPLAFIHRERIALAWYAYLLLAVPQFIGIFAQGFSSMSMNAAVVQMFTMLVIPATSLIFKSRPRTFLAAVCAVLSLHGVVGIWQWIAFEQGQFPLAWLYLNPSFAPFDATAIETYVEYIKRPFGITPEPSALMTMTTGWMLLLLSASIDRSQRGGVPFFRLTPWRLLGLSTLLFTMVLSESGGVMFFGAGMAVLILLNVARHHDRAPGLSLATIIGFVLVGVLAILHLTTRVERETGQLGSWDERSISIRIGFRLIRDADLMQMIFGYGGGEVSRIADRLQSTQAVHSWFLSEVVGYGLLGTLGLIGVAILIGRAIARSGDAATWTVIMLVWVVGPAILSGYIHLLSSWALLAIPLSLGGLGRGAQATAPSHRYGRMASGAAMALKTRRTPGAA